MRHREERPRDRNGIEQQPHEEHREKSTTFQIIIIHLGRALVRLPENETSGQAMRPPFGGCLIKGVRDVRVARRVSSTECPGSRARPCSTRLMLYALPVGRSLRSALDVAP